MPEHAPLSFVADGARQAVVATDPAGHITYWDGAAETLFGWMAGDVLGRPIFEIAVSEDDARAEIGTVSSKAADLAVVRLNNRYGGPQIDVRFAAARDREGNVVTLIGTAVYAADQRREKSLLAASAAVANILATEVGFGEAVRQAFGRIGRSVDVDRVYLFENHEDPASGEPVMSQRHEWTREGIAAHIDDPQLQSLPLRLFGEWAPRLAAGEAVGERFNNVPEGLKPLLREQKIQSLLLVPLMLDEAWYGVLGVDDCRRERIWHGDEVMLLRTVGRMLGSMLRVRDNERRFRTLVETTSQVIWLADEHGTIRILGGVWQNLTRQTPEESHDMGWVAAVHPSDRERVVALWREHVASKKELVTEFRVRDARGRYLWFRAHAVPVFDERGHFVEWFGTGTLIDKEKRAAEVVTRSETRFRQLADAMPQMVWTTRPDGHHDYFNQRWYDYVGIDPLTEGWGWVDVLHPDDVDRTVEIWRTSLESGEPYEIEYRFRRKDGVYRWHLGRALPVRDEAGRIERWYGTCTDIHDQIAIAEALRQSEVRYRSLFDHSMDGIMLTSPDGHILAANLAVCEMLGYTQEELVHLTRADLVDMSDPRLAEALRQRELHGQFRAELTFFRSDGSALPVEVSSGLFQDAQGMLRTSMFVRDITDVKRFREDLIEAKEKAEEMARLKSSLLSNMSHEIRTPLTAIIGFSDVLRESFGGETNDMVRIINDSARRLLDTLNSVLDLAQIESGGLKLAPSSVELGSFVQDSMEMFSRQAERKGLILQVEVPSEPLDVVIDRGALGRVLSNLVSNAVKFTSKGRITVSVTTSGGGIVLKVSDTGAGISPDFLPYVFDEFKQGSAGIARTHEGSGLGLTITHRLVEMMEGTISVTSDPGVGTSFTVRLPMKMHLDTPTTDRPSASATLPEHRLRLLVVED
ncbi:MAG: PAS domain S-box protein, partial [Bacteroidota bacterium]